MERENSMNLSNFSSDVEKDRTMNWEKYIALCPYVLLDNLRTRYHGENVN